jgi:SLT domain-containing protein
LNGLKTNKIVGEVDDLKKKLNDTSDEAKTLNNRLNDIANHKGGGGGGSSKGKSKKKALGGVLPGYTPGRDVHVFSSPTGGQLELSGGEAVMRPEWTAAIGADQVTRLNNIARTKGVGGVRQAMKFAKGGIIDKLGLQSLIDTARSFNLGDDVRGAAQTMTMDSSTRAIGGDIQGGVIGSGTSGSHYIGSDISDRLTTMRNFLTKDSWKILRRLPIPDGLTQIVGTVGGALSPIAGDYFWDDVWKGHGNILDRGNRYVNDLFSVKTLTGLVDNLFGGAWDSVKGLWNGGKELITDPMGAISDTVNGVQEMVRAQYDGVISTVKGLREIWQSPKDYASQVIGDIYSTAKDSLPNLEGLFDFSGDHLSSKGGANIEKLLQSQFSTPGVGGKVERWTPQVKMALAQLGLPMSDLGLVLHRIQVESGGNPKAINLWDSNAKAGHPSQGLMQTIPGTFAAYAGPYKSRGITDPMASIYAGLNYAVHRYGSGWRKALGGIKGYATGTEGAEPGWAWVGEEGPELVNFKGGETVLNHQDSLVAGTKTLRGYASGTKRTTGIAADAEKGVSSLNSAVKKLYEIISKAFSSGRIGKGTANSLNKWLDKENKSLQKIVKDRADLAPKLKAANDKLAAVKKDESEMATSIADKAKGLRSLTDVFNSDGVSTSSAISSLKERLATIKAFQSNISALTKRGFSKEIIAEISDAGPEQGGNMAKELLNATDSQVKEFNNTYAAIGTASDSLGKTVAGSYYAAGKKAAQSLVDGLTKQDKSLIKKIEGLADTIVKTLKKKLKISSKTPVDSGLASLLTWLTGNGQAIKGGGNTQKKTTRTTTTYSTDSQGRKVTTVTTTTTDPAKGTTTTVTKRTVGGKTTTSTRVSKIKGYATGTRSAARGVALVGEKGPELINFKGGERVYNDKETANMMGPRYEIHIHEAKSENTTQSVLRAMQYAEVMANM